MVLTVLEYLAASREITKIAVNIDTTGTMRGCHGKVVVHDLITVVVVTDPEITALY
jgi:hypothetical protein